ncbi:MAG TPA: tetratricopeptide repeat protein [Gemmataceae bacterium]|nr:tetratricopeptide repeat protein [Gemmataceae bacterium]
MSTGDVAEVFPTDGAPPARYAEAAALLERASHAGHTAPEVAYMLALAYKRQGKTPEARAALRKISKPDAAVFLQMGLLSLREKNLAQAEGEFSRAAEMDPDSFPACYNLLLTRLTLGHLELVRALLPRAIELADSVDEKRFLTLLQALLSAGQAGNGDAFNPALADMLPADEQRLLALLWGLGQLDVSHSLLKVLAAARPQSPPVQEAFAEVVLVKAKALMDKGDWLHAERELSPLARVKGLTRAHQTVLFNLLGLCSCLNQDFGGGVRYLANAVKLANADARIAQNMALAYELHGEVAQADPQWNRYFDLLTAGADLPRPPGQVDYHDRLAYEGLVRLGTRYSERERWSQALGYVQRAQRHRPRDPDVLERLFHLYNHLKRPEDARRTLRQLREVKPNEPQYDLFELDLVEVKNLSDIDRMLGEIERVMKRHPNDARVEERALTMVGNVVPLMHDLAERLTDELSKVQTQVRNLPNYKINWSAVSDVVRDLQREYQRLRKITNKCLPLVSRDEHRRAIRDLADLIDRKIEVCRSILR